MLKPVATVTFVLVLLTEAPVQVPVFAPVMVMPMAAMSSVYGAVSAIGAALALPRVSVSVDGPPIAMLAGLMVLALVGGVAVTSTHWLVTPLVTLAVPVTLAVVLVLVKPEPGHADMVGVALVVTSTLIVQVFAPAMTPAFVTTILVGSVTTTLAVLVPLQLAPI
jgi:hypothetical protein